MIGNVGDILSYVRGGLRGSYTSIGETPLKLPKAQGLERHIQDFEIHIDVRELRQAAEQRRNMVSAFYDENKLESTSIFESVNYRIVAVFRSFHSESFGIIPWQIELRPQIKVDGAWHETEIFGGEVIGLLMRDKNGYLAGKHFFRDMGGTQNYYSVFRPDYLQDNYSIRLWTETEFRRSQKLAKDPYMQTLRGVIRITKLISRPLRA